MFQMYLIFSFVTFSWLKLAYCICHKGLHISCKFNFKIFNLGRFIEKTHFYEFYPCQMTAINKMNISLKLFSQVLHNVRHNYIWQQLLSQKLLWMSDPIVANIILVQSKKLRATLNIIRALLKGVSINLCAHNFVHVKTFLRPRVRVTCKIITVMTISQALNTICQILHF